MKLTQKLNVTQRIECELGRAEFLTKCNICFRSGFKPGISMATVMMVMKRMMMMMIVMMMMMMERRISRWILD